MKTYTESKSERPFDWNEALNIDCAEMSAEHKENMKMLSGSWVTCACGNQCAVIRRYEGGMPVDTVLADLGLDFTRFVADMEYSQDIEDANACRRNAIEVLEEIEERSAHLIKTGS